MSAVEYTRCDGKDCGRVTPDEPGFAAEAGWARVRVWPDREYDLCEACAAKALAAVAAHLAGRPCADEVCEEVKR